jgi:hypothetical protein
MLNLRGLLTRLLGPGHDGPIFAASALVFATASAAIYRIFRRAYRRSSDGAIPPGVFAAGLALALPVNVHLHLQDALVWVVPLAILSAPVGGARDFARFRAFALCWPLVFVLTFAAETALGRLLPVQPPLVLATILAAWALREVRLAGGPTPDPLGAPFR